MDKIIIKQLALNEGFKLKQQPDNTMELNPYVYIFAHDKCDHIDHAISF